MKLLVCIVTLRSNLVLGNSLSWYIERQLHCFVPVETCVVLGGDSHSECSEESVSTSGCSSMIPHPDKHEYRGDVLSLTKPALDNLSKDLQDSLLSETRSKKDWRLSSSDAKGIIVLVR